MGCACGGRTRPATVRSARAGRTMTAVNWVAVEFTGTQPTVIRGPSGMRYTFVPQQVGQIDRRDLEMMLATGLVQEKQG